METTATTQPLEEEEPTVNNKRTKTEEEETTETPVNEVMDPHEERIAPLKAMLAESMDQWKASPSPLRTIIVSQVVNLLKEEGEKGKTSGMDIWQALTTKERKDIVEKCEGIKRKELPAYRYNKTVYFDTPKQELEDLFEQALCGELFSTHYATRCNGTVYDDCLFTWQKVIDNNLDLFKMLWNSSEYSRKLMQLVKNYEQESNVTLKDIEEYIKEEESEEEEDNDDDDEEEEEEKNDRVVDLTNEDRVCPHCNYRCTFATPDKEEE